MGGKVAIEYGDGNGGFNNKSYILEDLKLLWGSELADFEGDGYPDIIATSLLDSLIYFVRNKEGVFQNPEVIDSNKRFTTTHSADFERDGDIDLIVSGQIRYFNDGQGNFSSGSFYYPDDQFRIEADFDDDGEKEVVFANNQSLSIYKYSPTGYVEWIRFSAPGFYSGSEVAVIDYDGDGDLDIIGPDSGDFVLYRNNDNLSFEYVGVVSDLFGFDLDGTFISDDFDDDGDVDIIFYQAGALKIIYNLEGDPFIGGKVFWDTNQDTVFNEGERGISSNKVSLFADEEEILSTFTDQFGNFRLYISEGDYEVRAQALNTCWEETYKEPIPINFTEVLDQSLEFPMILEGEGSSFIGSSSHAPTRCGFTVRFFQKIINDGCMPSYGSVSFTLDEKIKQFFDPGIPHIIEGNMIKILNVDLLPGESFSFNYLVEIPGVEFLGEYLNNTLAYNYDLIDGTLSDLEFSDSFTSQIQCAYDPNDKLAFPDRREDYDKQYVLDEAIQYTIRFQNTGTDTAFNIRLVDTLSTNLDLRTFKPIDASHGYILNLDEVNRVLEIRFDNVLLPDSIVNEPSSHGFFTFLIHPIADLDEFTPIHNKAEIYFDFNPPIVTNTVEMEYVSELWLATDTKETKISETIIFPNPAENSFTIKMDREIQTIKIYDSAGVLLKNSKSAEDIDINNISNGIYFVHIHSNDGVRTEKLMILRD